MKVAEIERLVQQVTERLFEKLQPAQYRLALLEEKPHDLQRLFSSFLAVDWVTENLNVSMVDGLVVHQMTISQVSAVAQLMPTDKKTEIILSFLLTGKPVLVLQTEGDNRFNKRKYHLSKKIAQFHEQCQLYGVHFSAYQKEDCEAFLRECRKRTIPIEAPTRSYVTEVQLKDRRQLGKVQLTSDERLTPLARDYALKHRLFK